MYSFVRQRMHGRTERSLSVLESAGGGEKYTSHKCMRMSDLSHSLVDRSM